LGRWKTPHQLAKIASKSELGTALHLGDQGIWVTYARGMHSKAVREFKELCDEVCCDFITWAVITAEEVLPILVFFFSNVLTCLQYGESMFGIPKPGDEHDNADSDDDDDGDIEASIQKELDAMKAPREKPTTQLAFTPVSSGIECVFFMKTLAPVDPVRLVRKICEDAEACPDPRMRKCRYINRLTPVVSTERASDNGIDRVARAVLAPVFKLKAEEGAAEQAEQQDESLKTVGDEDGDGDGDGGKAYTVSNLPLNLRGFKPFGAVANCFVQYAIRHTVRNHNVFKSDYVIKKIAEMIDPKHKVNLTNPDKVILVEVFQVRNLPPSP
jgi:tRNA acetyltransferase TAN1